MGNLKMNNISPPRFVKSFYRKEPITGLLITVGAVNMVLGGVNAMGSLLLLGMMVAGSSIAYRWWMIQQAEARLSADRPLYLPPARSQSDYTDYSDR
jgi:hypothetical protein